MVSKCFEYNGLMYYFSIDFNKLELVQNLTGKRSTIKTRNASGYAIKINKSGVSADGGAAGVFRFLSDCISNDFMMCYVYKIVDMFA